MTVYYLKWTCPSLPSVFLYQNCIYPLKSNRLVWNSGFGIYEICPSYSMWMMMTLGHCPHLKKPVSENTLNRKNVLQSTSESTTMSGLRTNQSTCKMVSILNPKLLYVRSESQILLIHVFEGMILPVKKIILSWWRPLEGVVIFALEPSFLSSP